MILTKPVLLSVSLQCVRPLCDTCLLGLDAMLLCVLCLALLGMLWLYLLLAQPLSDPAAAVCVLLALWKSQVDRP